MAYSADELISIETLAVLQTHFKRIYKVIKRSLWSGPLSGSDKEKGADAQTLSAEIYGDFENYLAEKPNLLWSDATRLKIMALLNCRSNTRLTKH